MAHTSFSGRFGTVAINLVLAGVSALLLTASFPAFSYASVAWIALVPLMVVIYRAGYVEAVVLGFVSGVLFFLVYMNWTYTLEEATVNNFLLFVSFLALPFPLFALTAKYFHERFPGWEPFGFPAIWVAAEYLKTHASFLSFQHGVLGYSQFKTLNVAAIAEFAGVYGISFVIVAVNASLTVIVWKFVTRASGAKISGKITATPSLVMLGVVALVVCAFTVRSAKSGIPENGSNSLKIAVIQGNAVADKKTVPATYMKEVFPVYLNYSLQAAKDGAQMIVWPSSAVPGVIPGDRRMTSVLTSISRKLGVYLLVGAAGYDKFNARQTKTNRVANSAFLFSPAGGLPSRYDKIHLLPFDEYIPLRNSITWPEWIVPPETLDHFPGNSLTLFKAGEYRFGVQICFENMFPEQFRQIVANGADFMVGQTNEIYVKNSPAAQYQNLSFYVLRAIENQVPLVRSSTNGVSCFIGTNGRIISSVQDSAGKELNVTGVASATIPLLKRRTFYNKYGDVMPLSAICLVLMALTAGSIKNYHNTA